MGIKKLWVHLKVSLHSDRFKKASKRKSMQRLLAKLKSKKEICHNISKETLDKKDLADAKENLAILTLQIKKGEHILEKLSI